MPTPRHDAAYKSRHEDAQIEAAGMSDDILRQHISILGKSLKTIGEEADFDACVDEALRRGINWHSRLAPPEPSEWDGEIPW